MTLKSKLRFCDTHSVGLSLSLLTYFIALLQNITSQTEAWAYYPKPEYRKNTATLPENTPKSTKNAEEKRVRKTRHSLINRAPWRRCHFP